jgi:hypothetical protein
MEARTLGYSNNTLRLKLKSTDYKPDEWAWEDDGHSLPQTRHTCISRWAYRHRQAWPWRGGIEQCGCTAPPNQGASPDTYTVYVDNSTCRSHSPIPASKISINHHRCLRWCTWARPKMKAMTPGLPKDASVPSMLSYAVTRHPCSHTTIRVVGAGAAARCQAVPSSSAA